MALRDALADGQAQAEAARGKRILLPVEKALEKMRKRIAVHAAARIGDAELDKAPLRLHAHAHAAARGGKFERVGQKVQQQLSQRGGIHADDAAVALGGKVEPHAAE